VQCLLRSENSLSITSSLERSPEVTSRQSSAYSKRIPPYFTSAGETENIPLHLALNTSRHRCRMLKFLLEAGADANVQDQLGNTALHIAAHQGYLRTAELLLNNGADPNTADRKGRRPLHEAVKEDHVRIVELLLDRGADPNASDAVGCTALHVAALYAKERIARLLLDRGAKATARTHDGHTPRSLVDALRKHRPK